MGEHTKQARLDNWAMFVMSRLQVFFNTTDYCDLTLQFEGNVQLKVHRVIMNACTEYFKLLEQECDIDGDVLIMPPDLQADVILPIVNFMYTGILEYQHSIFDRLYQTAELMNMTVLLKFLDAQRTKVKAQRPQQNTFVKRPIRAESKPVIMPGRKLPLWKRKSAPTQAQVNPVKLYLPESRSVGDASRFDNAPKPTRFEWPDDDMQDIKPFDLLPLDSTFDSISYSSKPLMTQEEEMRSSCNSTVFDDLRQLPSGKVTKRLQEREREKDTYSLNSSVDMEDLKSYVKEQKIRSGLAEYDDDDDDEEDEDDDDPDDPDYVDSTDSNKRKVAMSTVAAKKPRVSNEKENVVEIRASSGKVDHSKIISEVIKKYPHLVQKNKNIRLKILAKNKADEKGAEKSILEKEKPKARSFVPSGHVQAAKKMAKSTEAGTSVASPAGGAAAGDSSRRARAAEQTWVCTTCTSNGEPVEFVLYYLYRKHMTDAHHKQFDARECKHCGELYELPMQMTYHMYMAHAVAPPRNVAFPKCARCSFVAFDRDIMARHDSFHEAHAGHVQCANCKLGFATAGTLKAHMQLAGHNGRNQLSFDCQYCTRQLNSATSLFVHCRTTHAEDAKRDGMLGLDEAHLEALELHAEEGEQAEAIADAGAEDAKDAPGEPPEKLAAPPVEDAASIASSLGSFDIVVLDHQQQYIIEGSDEQGAPAAIAGQQGFMTLPTLQQQPYSLGQADIGSTDELVMVLTDHDYNDGTDDALISNDNSNIVVLYSHPVDGQQNQFITSQGNLMLNSETGMLEIHNDGVPISTQGESIEMIQKEIQSSMGCITSTTDSQNVVTSAVEAGPAPGPAKLNAHDEGDKKLLAVEEQGTGKFNTVKEVAPDAGDTTDFGTTPLPFSPTACSGTAMDQPEPEPMDIDEPAANEKPTTTPPIPSQGAGQEREKPTPITEDRSVAPSIAAPATTSALIETESSEVQQPRDETPQLASSLTQEIVEKDGIPSVCAPLAALTTIEHRHQPEIEVPQELLEPATSEAAEVPECTTVAVAATVSTLATLASAELQTLATTTEVENELINQTAPSNEYKTCASLSVSEQCPEEPMEVDGLASAPDASKPKEQDALAQVEAESPNHMPVDATSHDDDDEHLQLVVEDVDASTFEETAQSELADSRLASETTEPTLLDQSHKPDVSEVAEVNSVAVDVQPEGERDANETLEAHEDAASGALIEGKAIVSTMDETSSLPESIGELPLDEAAATAAAVAPARPVELDILQDASTTDERFEKEKRREESKDKTEGISTLLNDWDDTDSQTSEQGSKAAAVNKLINDWDDE